MQGIIDLPVEGLRSGRFSDMNHLAVVPFHRRGNTHVGGQTFPDGGPPMSDALLPQLDADGMRYMVRQNRYEKVPIGPVFLLMIHRAQPHMSR
jgi:hypothetical protein